MVGKHLLLAVSLCVFPATIDGGFLRSRWTEPSSALPAQTPSQQTAGIPVAEQTATAQAKVVIAKKNLAKAIAAHIPVAEQSATAKAKVVIAKKDLAKAIAAGVPVAEQAAAAQAKADIAKKDLAKAVAAVRDAHTYFTIQFRLMKELKARVKELEPKVYATDVPSGLQESSADAAKVKADGEEELAKAHIRVHAAQADFNGRWRAMKGAEVRVKVLEAKAWSKELEANTTRSIQEYTKNAAKVRTDDSGYAPSKSASPKTDMTNAKTVVKSAPAAKSTSVAAKSTSAAAKSTSEAAINDTGQKNASVNSASSKVNNVPSKDDAAVKSASTKTKHQGTDKAPSSEKDVIDVFNTEAIDRYLEKFSTPDKKPMRSAPPLPTSSSLSRMLSSSDSCRGCSENLALAYQKCTADYGDPCKRMPDGRMRDSSCCSRKTEHNSCLKCAHDGCPSSSGCGGINEQYYSERSVVLQA